MADQLSDWAKEYFRQYLPPPEDPNRPAPHAAKPTAHARLGFSGADRWIACGASVRASEGLPDMVTPYAREGSAAHEVAAHCLIDQMEAIEWGERMIDLGDNGPKITVDEMMVAGVQKYLDLVAEENEYGFNPDIQMVVEHQGSLERFDPEFFKIEPIFGTCDVRLFKRHLKRLTIIDLKYGYKFVDVKKPQTKGYALMEMLSDELINEEIVEVELIICQPRSPVYEGEPVRRLVISVDELLRWANEEMMPAAKRTLDPNAPFVAGDHCVFCRYAPHCKTLREHAWSMAEVHFDNLEAMPTGDLHRVQPLDPTKLSVDQCARLLSVLPNMENWIKAVKMHGFALANAGIKLHSNDGQHKWKLVSRRGRRKWTPTDEQDIRLALAVNWGIPVEKQDVHKLASPAQIEVAMKEIYGRQWRKIATRMGLSGLYETRASGCTLAPESDTRDEVVGVELSMFEALED